MSDMTINAVLAQIRSLSAQAGAGFNPVAQSTQGAPSVQDLAGTASGAGLTGTGMTGTSAAQGPSFAQLLQQGINTVNDTQQSADALASAWERGAPGVDLAQVMVETQKASVSFQALAQVRNRLIGVYQDIMNMSI